MKKYIYIDQSIFSDMHLSGNDAIIYALIASYCESGHVFDTKVDDIAERINVSRNCASNSIDRLEKAGYIQKIRKQYSITIKLSDDWKVRYPQCGELRYPQCGEPDTHNVKGRYPQCGEPDTHNVGITPYITNNSNNNIPNREFFFETTNKIFADHYKAATGRDYSPNFHTHTSAIAQLIDKIRARMVQCNFIPDDKDTYRSYLAEWIRLSYLRSDQWHQERWTVEFVNSQFNYFDTIINQQQKNGTNNPRRDEISDDYIREQLSTIDAGGGLLF